MARTVGKLTALAVSKASKKGRYSDGGGLYLRVKAGGSKSWIFRYMLSGERREMGLGPVDLVSLAEARDFALECRRQLRNKVDPIEARKKEFSELLGNATKSITFEDAARAYFEAHKAGWRNAKHSKQWVAPLKNFAYPVLGRLDVRASPLLLA